MANSYKDYFEINRGYYPEVNESSIKTGDIRWQDTFPHETFVALLKQTERMLARGSNGDKKGIWIEGAYGTGKSRVAWTLKNILDCPNNDLIGYFEAKAPLRQEKDLLTKLVAHKERKIVTAWRYSSGGISGNADLMAAVYQSVSDALRKAGCDTLEEKTLRGSMARFFAKPGQKAMLAELIRLPGYAERGAFAGKSVDDLLATLVNESKECDTLVRELLDLAKNEGISGLAMTMDDLIAWLKEAIAKNGISALVMVWDEFSSYFKNNRTTLDEFQKLAELANEAPFYLVIVTHESGSLLGEDRSAKIVSDRFKHESIEIPDTIAFELIRDALVVKEAQKAEWAELVDDLAARTRPAREAVRKYAWRGESGGEGVLEGILPIHPMAALLLKNISKNFASNQRSMFNFIKDDGDGDLEAFQKFIATHSPDEGDVLGVDYLWDFFYAHGRDERAAGAGRNNLDAGIRAILDVYPQYEGQLVTDERRVLKAVLMMQAMNVNLGGSVPLLVVTEQNLNLAFAGIDGLEDNRAVNFAKALVKKEILFERPLANGRKEFSARTSGGDPGRVGKFKDDVRAALRTSTFVTEGKLVDSIQLRPAQKFRFDVHPATAADFKQVANMVANKAAGHRIHVLLCFAKDETEGGKLREMIREAMGHTQNVYKRIVFVDATQNVLPAQKTEQWIEYKAYEKAFRDSDRAQSDQASRDAQGVLEAWRNDIANGAFTVWSDEDRAGRNCSGAGQVLDALSEVVSRRWPFQFDAMRGASEQMFATSALSDGAKRGIEQTSGGRFQENIVTHAIGSVRNIARYWENVGTANLPLSRLKVQLGKKIERAFRQDGRIAIEDVFDYLVEQGFMPCNLYAYLTGFLLKEYAGEPYRWGDETTGGAMSAEKLAEMISGAIKQKNEQNQRYRQVYIQIMTPEQKAFTKLAADAFGLPEDSSIEQLEGKIKIRLQDLGWPLWMVAESATSEIVPFLEEIAAFANPQNTGENASKIAGEIGAMAEHVPSAAAEIGLAIAPANAKDAARVFLDTFDDGAFKAAAEKIHAAEPLEEVRRVFTSGDGAWLWNRETGEREIRGIVRDYQIVSAGNEIVSVDAHSFAEFIAQWKESIKSIRMPQADLVARRPTLKPMLSAMREILRTGTIPQEKRDVLLENVRAEAATAKDLFGAGAKTLFAETYADHLAGLSESDIADVYARLPMESFSLDKSEYLQRLLDEIGKVRRQQTRYRLEQFWKEKTGSKNALDWSRMKKTPVIAMFSVEDEVAAKRAMDALDRPETREEDVAFALEWLETQDNVFARMNDAVEVDRAFVERVVQPFASVLTDIAYVRGRLDATVGEPSEWLGATAHRVIESEAEAAYATHGAQRVMERIDEMDDETLRSYLKRLVRNNVRIGAEILGGKEE